MAFDAPTSPNGRMSFEVVFDPTVGLDPWDAQLLHASRYLASLLLELERCRTLAPPSRPRQDGTMPLVG